MATEGGVGAGGYGDRTATAHDNKRASGGGLVCGHYGESGVGAKKI